MRLWDWICLSSLVGIWPRWIEPNLLRTTHFTVALNDLPHPFVGKRIALLSDLHLAPFLSDRYLMRLRRHLERSKPDLILLPGDLICFSKMDGRVGPLLSSLKAPLGRFASLGNHDYAGYPVRNASGLFDLPDALDHPITRLLQKIVRPSPHSLSTQVSEQVRLLPPHPDLLKEIEQSGFRLLHNATCQIEAGGAKLNITGLGDYWLGRCLPQLAFQNYDERWPGIVLSHNPDTAGLLTNYPGELIVSGHTHGGQINLPMIADKIVSMENSLPKSGYAKFGGKQMVISRGLGAAEPFRLFAPPELPIIVLERSN